MLLHGTHLLRSAWLFVYADPERYVCKFPRTHSSSQPYKLLCHTVCHSVLTTALALQAFDGGLQHKWLDFGGANKGVTWLEYRRLPSQAAVAVTRYSLTSADDEPNRDPCDFVLEGCVEFPMASGTPLYHYHCCYCITQSHVSCLMASATSSYCYHPYYHYH